MKKSICFKSVKLKKYKFMLVCFYIFMPTSDVISDELVHLQRSNKDVSLIFNSHNSVEYELISLKENKKSILNLYDPDYFDILNDYVNSIPHHKYEPCINNIAVKRLPDMAQLIIDIDSGLRVNIFKEKLRNKKHYRIILDMYSDPLSDHTCTVNPLRTRIENDKKYQFQSDNKEVGRNTQARINETKKPAKSPFKLKAYMMYDFVFGIGDADNWNSALEKSNDKEIRRIKLLAKGGFGYWDYKLGITLTDIFDSLNDGEIYRAYVSYNRWRFVDISAGLQPEPFGLEKSTSSRYLTLMERSVPITFMPGDNLGILFSTKPSLRYFLDIGFYTKKPYSEDGKVDHAVTGRLGYSPVNNRRRLLYSGFSTSLREPKDGLLRYRTRPEVYLANKLFSSDKMKKVENITLANFEVAAVYGPLSIQSEYIWTHVKFDDLRNKRVFSSYYIFSSLFLSGESRQYARGNFGRVKPRRKVGKGMGAWEIAFRQSQIEDDNQQKLNVRTFGINWYLNNNSRLMLNWVDTTYILEQTRQDSELIQLRLQIQI